jgi:hypothetical protein
VDLASSNVVVVTSRDEADHPDDQHPAW